MAVQTAAKTKASSKAKTKSKTTTKATAKKAAKKSSAKSAGAKATGKSARSTKPKKVSLTVDAMMTPNPYTTRPGANLGEAAMRLWEGDCGALPVLGDDGDVVGMITDRDVCMALAMSGARARDRSVSEVMATPVVRCHPGDDVSAALAAMAEHRVRRLPVIDKDGHLAGVVSIADIIRKAGSVLDGDKVLGAMKDMIQPYTEDEPKI